MKFILCRVTLDLSDRNVSERPIVNNSNDIMSIQGTTFQGVRILWYFHHAIKVLSAHWISGKANWTPDYSHHLMQWNPLG